MQAPRELAAALLSAAIILVSGGTALAGGGHGNGHGHDKGAPAAASSTNQAGNGAQGNGEHGNGPGNAPGAAGASRGPGGQETTTTRTDRDRAASGSGQSGANDDVDSQNRFRGGVTDIDAHQAKVRIKTRDGQERVFDVDAAVVNDLKSRRDTNDLVFFSADGKRITAVAKIGETDSAKVLSVNQNAVVLQTKNGETRVITLDAKSIKRLHIHTGSDLEITTSSAQGGRIVSREMLRKHWSDKFAAKARKARGERDNDSDKGVADAGGPAGCGRHGASGHGRAFANQMAKDAANDASGHNPPGLPHECVNPAGHTRGFCKSRSSDSECGAGSSLASTSDVDTSPQSPNPQDCSHGSHAAGHGRAFANQMSKDAANDASGHNPPGLPHECVNPAGHTRGWCKSRSSDADCGAGSSLASTSDVETSSQNGNKQDCTHGSTHAAGHGRAYANQMAKDAANDASGHNPPGLPHECVNPAGHTRGWCKSHGSTESVCGAAVAATTTETAAVAGANAATAAASATGSTAGSNAGANGTVGGGRAQIAGPAGNGILQPGGRTIPAGNAMAGNSAIAAVPSAHVTGGTATAARSMGPVAMAKPAHRPTRVLGAAVGPSEIHLVKPLANTPCVWHRTAVAGATYHRNRIVGTSRTRTHVTHRTACH